MSDEATVDSSGRRVAGNAAWLMAADLVGKASNVALVVILARGLGPRQYGHFAFALAFLPLFLHLARWGIDIASLRRITLRREDFPLVFVNGGLLRLVLAVAAALAGLALAPLLVREGDPFGVVAVLAVALVLDEVATYQMVAFTAFERMRYDAAILVTNRIVSTALAGVVVGFGGGLLAVSAAYLLGSLGAVVVGGLFIARLFPRLHVVDVCRDELGGLLRQGAPYGIANFLNMAVFRLDAVLLQVLKGPVAVGVYGVAYRFFEPLLFVTWSIAQAATPRMVRDTAGRQDTRTFELSLAATLAFYLPIAAGAPFVAGWLLEAGFGARYGGAEAAVIWLTAASVPYAAAHLARMGSIAAGERRSVTTVAAMVLAFNVALNLVLIPGYGVAGAAAATFATEVVECVLLVGLYVRRVEAVRAGGPVAVPLLAAAAMALVLWATGATGPVALVVGPVVFLGALVVASRALVPGDLRSLVGALRSGTDG